MIAQKQKPAQASRPTRDKSELDHLAEQMKERIYATLALLAVLVSIDTGHTSASHAELIVAGTALSLWAASVMATKMSNRIILREYPPTHHERLATIRAHSQLLMAAAAPVILIFFSYIGFLPLSFAVNGSILFLILLMVGWSLLSARSMRYGWMQTTILASIELGIGLAIVSLKLFVGH
jgi:hypothetical protein